MFRWFLKKCRAMSFGVENCFAKDFDIKLKFMECIEEATETFVTPLVPIVNNPHALFNSHDQISTLAVNEYIDFTGVDNFNFRIAKILIDAINQMTRRMLRDWLRRIFTIGGFSNI